MGRAAFWRELFEGLVEGFLGVLPMVVVPLGRSEWVVGVGDVLTVSVVLDGAGGVGPVGARGAIGGAGSERGEVAGRVGVVAGDELVETHADGGLDGGDAGELGAVRVGVGVVSGLLVERGREGVVGLVESFGELFDVLGGEEPLRGVLATVAERPTRFEFGEVFALSVEVAFEFVA